MKPRSRWLARFTSWFFNTSPEWDETKQRGRGNEEAPHQPRKDSSQPPSRDPNDVRGTREPPR
jgi:hypothetical protein